MGERTKVPTKVYIYKDIATLLTIAATVVAAPSQMCLQACLDTSSQQWRDVSNFRCMCEDQNTETNDCIDQICPNGNGDKTLCSELRSNLNRRGEVDSSHYLHHSDSFAGGLLPPHAVNMVVANSTNLTHPSSTTTAATTFVAGTSSNAAFAGSSGGLVLALFMALCHFV
ncbi:hypothetical protein TRVA0_003S01816 [Trichomonascus vanleenenianus]|uniref:uncharacterized protein n=1 Tax=Trichomonascus vanleenenianus TaxID=2268995 RepID=UPI003ECA82D2